MRKRPLAVGQASCVPSQWRDAFNLAARDEPRPVSRSWAAMGFPGPSRLAATCLSSRPRPRQMVSRRVAEDARRKPRGPLARWGRAPSRPAAIQIAGPGELAGGSHSRLGELLATGRLLSAAGLCSAAETAAAAAKMAHGIRLIRFVVVGVAVADAAVVGAAVVGAVRGPAGARRRSQVRSRKTTK